jgi:hypothetical protein
MFKKNAFENVQKVALNITVMDDISHQILVQYIMCCLLLNRKAGTDKMGTLYLPM